MVVDLPPRFARGPDCMNIRVYSSHLRQHQYHATHSREYMYVVFTLQLLDPMLPGLNFLFG